ncbi:MULTISPECIES: toll/interleukin-1 receptor domain-containing protein [Bradyrhizobium]
MNYFGNLGSRMPEKSKKIFISYSHQDSEIVERVLSSLRTSDVIDYFYEFFFDTEAIRIGGHIADSLATALKSSDYYVLFISESSQKSDWVKREIATAFELARKKELTVVPLLVQGAEVPFEFRGLLYVDFREDFTRAVRQLEGFFESEVTQAREVAKPNVAGLQPHPPPTACKDFLGVMRLGDLRQLLTRRLTNNDIKVVWFDVFNTRMEDEVGAVPLALSCVELLDRARRQEVLDQLLKGLCQNHPYLGKAAEQAWLSGVKDVER